MKSYKKYPYGTKNSVVDACVSSSSDIKKETVVNVDLDKENKISSNRNNLMDNSMQSSDKIVTDEDEKCFICGDGGVLLLCDFPACPRVYHKVSRYFNSLLYIILLGCGVTSE